jgi:PEP-CTERM motif
MQAAGGMRGRDTLGLTTQEIPMKKMLLLSSLMLALGGAHAGTWTFTYQGFEREGAFDPGYQLSGSFSGEDLDADHAIERGELTYLELAGQVYVGEDNGSGVEYILDSFRYGLSGALQFASHYSYGDEAYHWEGAIVSGDYLYYSWDQIWTGEHHSSTMRWTDQTSFTIVPPPVPEPASFAMLGAGALLLGARRWQQRRRETTGN